jgi:hypothetical protein
MDRRTLLIVGIGLIVLGGLSLALSVGASLLGFNPLSFVWRLWPAIVMGAGLGLVVPPFLVRGKRGLGALLIPGFPILTVGGLLFLASVLDAWSIWSWLWPMLILSLAMGFVFAGIYMRLVWLLIPAIIIGLNGLMFQFCAITGLWHWWSVLWTIEPLAVGLALLVPGLLKGVPGLTTAGSILCGVAGAGFMLMLTVLGAWLPIALVGPALLVVAGLAVLGWAFLRPALRPNSALE